MIIKNKKLLFVHIPRTAGTAIEKSLSVPRGKAVMAQHKTFKEYLDKQSFNSYFKFSFVRNPWDRIVSWYLWSHADIIYYQDMADQGIYCNSKNPVQAWDKGKKIMSSPESIHINKKFYLKFKNSFAAFVESLPSQLNNNLNLSDVNIHVNRQNRLTGKWIMPQVEWLKNKNGEINLDFIGKYENFPKDISKLFKQIKHSGKKVPVVGHIFNKPNYRRFYTKKTQEIIKEVYSEDIEFFDYEF